MLKDILHFRRAVRYYAPTPISEEKVRECLRLATLAPTGFNMQLYELYHITDKALLEKLAQACLGQLTASTAQQMVVFVTRQDKHRQHAKMILEFERGNIQRNSPPERQAKRIKDKEKLYEKLIPFVYSRFFGLLGAFRKLSGVIGWFRPMVRELSESDIRVEVHKSCGLAAQTFMLAMAEEGYDTCPLGGMIAIVLKNYYTCLMGLKCVWLSLVGFVKSAVYGVKGLDYRLRKCIEIINS